MLSREEMFEKYKEARSYFLKRPQTITSIEKCLTHTIITFLSQHYEEIERDYNEASRLEPFWENYKPSDRGRDPVGDQIPWIEVGEISVGDKLTRLLSERYFLREIGLPSGSDNRFLIKNKTISLLTNEFTDSAMVFIDVKSTGPRDSHPQTVISNYQASGNGLWESLEKGMKNDPIEEKGERTSHLFYPSLSPIYILSDGSVALAVHLFVKPIYDVESTAQAEEKGLSHNQPLKEIKVICMPNGLTMTVNPNYLSKYPGLLFPGKDDKSKAPEKIRARLSFDKLSKIAEWRVQTVDRSNCLKLPSIFSDILK